MKMTYLPDVNVWLAMSFRSHVHFSKAAAWYQSVNEDASILFCRMTQQGFLRLATHPKVAGSEVVTLADAWKLYDRIFEDSRVGYAIEPRGIEARWRAFTQSPLFSPKVWNDAYLAAFAVEGGCELVTLDGGFAQLNLPHCTILA